MASLRQFIYPQFTDSDPTDQGTTNQSGQDKNQDHVEDVEEVEEDDDEMDGVSDDAEDDDLEDDVEDDDEDVSGDEDYLYADDVQNGSDNTAIDNGNEQTNEGVNGNEPTSNESNQSNDTNNNTDNPTNQPICTVTHGGKVFPQLGRNIRNTSIDNENNDDTINNQNVIEAAVEVAVKAAAASIPNSKSHTSNKYNKQQQTVQTKLDGSVLRQRPLDSIHPNEFTKWIPVENKTGYYLDAFGYTYCCPLCLKRPQTKPEHARFCTKSVNFGLTNSEIEQRRMEAKQNAESYRSQPRIRFSVRCAT